MAEKVAPEISEPHPEHLYQNININSNTNANNNNNRSQDALQRHNWCATNDASNRNGAEKVVFGMESNRDGRASERYATSFIRSFFGKMGLAGVAGGSISFRGKQALGASAGASKYYHVRPRFLASFEYRS